MSRRGWTLFIIMGIIWGTPYLLIRVAVREVPPPTLLFMRTAPAALVLVPFALRRAHLQALRPHWKALVCYTLGELAIPWLFVARAEQRISSSLAGLLVATVPMFALVIALVTRHEDRIGWRRLAGLGIGFAGVACVVGIAVSGADRISVAELLVVASGYALGPWIYSRYLGDVPPLTVVAASIGLVALIYLPFMIFDPPHHLGSEAILSVATLSLLCTVIAFFLFFRLIDEVGPSRAVVITYINPAVALVLGVAFLGEHFSVGIAVGFPLILIGSVLGTGGNAPPRASEGEELR